MAASGAVGRTLIPLALLASSPWNQPGDFMQDCIPLACLGLDHPAACGFARFFTSQSQTTPAVRSHRNPSHLSDSDGEMEIPHEARLPTLLPQDDADIRSVDNSITSLNTVEGTEKVDRDTQGPGHAQLRKEIARLIADLWLRWVSDCRTMKTGNRCLYALAQSESHSC
ncbi:hypothetical protein ASPCADRAFT_6127 [Aspergillus carbonarius ITEM 5010]|uniref:Aflatoxin regulatory protein domain-containing protein n=1 Tax=Aspergillus carbonarius (strain ITEM 5010) TaxID=602072 RepID=A0A1R3RM96_ASPC5|nr:hypothetical protein ASPCADRAFT_6127 [Aspergillus carbonarius ITEM 5010]